jgi:hypothetical protein
MFVIIDTGNAALYLTIEMMVNYLQLQIINKQEDII